MKRVIPILLLMLSLGLPFGSYAQQNKIDSLQKCLKEATNDTTKIQLLNALGWKIMYTNPDTAILLSKQALALTQKLPKQGQKYTAQTYRQLGAYYYLKSNYLVALDFYCKALKIYRQIKNNKGRASVLGNIGNVYTAQSNYPKALEYDFKALKINEDLGNKNGIASTFVNIGIVYKNQSDYPKALEYYFKALKINEDLGNKNGIAINLGNIGNVYENQSDYPKALEYYFKALKIYKELDNKNSIAAVLGNIGIVYYEQSDYPKSLEYFFKSLKINEALGNKNGVARNIGNIGNIYNEQANYPEALIYYFKSLKIAEELGNKTGIALNLGNIGALYTKTSAFKKAENHLKKAIALSDSLGALNEVKIFEKSINQLYDTLALLSTQGKHYEGFPNTAALYRLAYQHYKNYITARDSIASDEKIKQQAHLETKFEMEKQATEVRLKHEKEMAVEQEAQKKQRIIIYSTSGAFVLILIFAILILRTLRLTKTQKQIIEKQKQQVEATYTTLSETHHKLTEAHKDITDSINYGAIIQQAFLASEAYCNKVLNNHFIFFQPKDVVSGDFYWVYEKNNTVWFAAADCTGHGVPGAFMSLVCNNFLNESIIEKGRTSPAAILNEVREGIVSVFRRGGATPKQDGMDCSLCKWDKTTNELTFSGANNPLYVVRKNLTEIEEIKGDKIAVGYAEDYQNKPFSEKTITLQKGDAIYIFSDGFADQFGGEKGKKLKYKPFKNLLLTLQDKEMKEQKAILNQHFTAWKGDLEQVDDVCVIGVKI